MQSIAEVNNQSRKENHSSSDSDTATSENMPVESTNVISDTRSASENTIYPSSSDATTHKPKEENPQLRDSIQKLNESLSAGIIDAKEYDIRKKNFICLYKD